MKALGWLCLLWGLAEVACALPPISVKGTKFYDDTGKQFFVKGIAYSGGVANMDDVLSNTTQCQIDAGLMRQAGINTIRVYLVDATQKHDGCMQAFDSQGIYVWLDLPDPLKSINRVSPEWTKDLFDAYSAKVDAFAGYDNLLSFIIGNEIFQDNATTRAAPFVKAATRDIKAFRKARGYRDIPIAYSAGDFISIRKPSAEYLACLGGSSDDDSSTIDVFAMNSYSWCGDADVYTAAFDTLYSDFQNLNIPVLFSEVGCTTATSTNRSSGRVARSFGEIPSILGPVFQAVFSGAVVYEWMNEANSYGIVSYPGRGSSLAGFPSTLADYNALKTAYSQADPTGTEAAKYTPSNGPPKCPASDGTWAVAGSAALPTARVGLETVTARTTITTGRVTSGSTTAAGTASKTGAQASDGASTSSSAAKQDSGPPVGAIAGGAVGGIVLLLAIAGAAFFLYRRRKARQQNGSVVEKNSPWGSDSGQDDANKAELHAVSAAMIVPRQELDAREHHAAGKGYYAPVAAGGEEAEHQRSRYEMEGDTPAWVMARPHDQDGEAR